MTTVPHVHYRLQVENGAKAPSSRRNNPLDVTGRACVPCAVVGHYRPADAFDEVGMPQCIPHAEFSGLDVERQNKIISDWSVYGPAVGVLSLLSEFREACPEWLDRFGGGVPA